MFSVSIVSLPSGYDITGRREELTFLVQRGFRSFPRALFSGTADPFFTDKNHCIVFCAVNCQQFLLDLTSRCLFKAHLTFCAVSGRAANRNSFRSIPEWFPFTCTVFRAQPHGLYRNGELARRHCWKDGHRAALLLG